MKTIDIHRQYAIGNKNYHISHEYTVLIIALNSHSRKKIERKTAGSKLMCM